MNPRVIKRFTIIVAVATVLFVLFHTFYDYLFNVEPGDYHVRKGDIRLSEGSYGEAMENFNIALEEMPNHRGALMGRALVFIQTGQYEEATAELNHLIDYLHDTIDNPEEDRTGWGVLAAAYANRGIIRDRQGQYEEALRDYIAAIETDEGALGEPGLFDRIIHGYRHSTVRDRAIYLNKQLQLPEEERVLRVPELDEEQRMYKPGRVF